MEDHGVVSLAHDLGSLNSGDGPTETAPPDPKQHRNISLFKSGARIFGYGLLLTPQYAIGVLILVLAEVLGILEELV